MSHDSHVIHQGLRSVVLTVRDWQVFRDPLQRPACGPGSSVCSGVVDCDFVLHRVHVGSRESLDEMKLLRVRKTSIAEPELFVQSFCIDDERVPFPTTSRVAVIKRIGVVAAKIALLRSSICVYEMPVMIAAPGHYKNSSESLLF